MGSGKFQFSLRTACVAVALFMVWGGYHTNRAIQERRAEAVLRKRGAQLHYRNDWSLWGERFISEVRIESEIDSELASAFGTLPYLRRLGVQAPRLPDDRQGDWEDAILPRAHVSDAVFATLLSGDSLLTELELDGFVLDGGKCGAIGRCRRLEEINISRAFLPEEALWQVLNLPRLNRLQLRYCNVTGNCLDNRLGSSSIRSVECYLTPIGRDFAYFIAKCTNACELVLRDKSVDDNFIKALGPHPAMMSLDLGGSSITDESVAVLMQMQQLIHLELPSGVSADARARLEDSLAARRIQRRPAIP